MMRQSFFPSSYRCHRRLHLRGAPPAHADLSNNKIRHHSFAASNYKALSERKFGRECHNENYSCSTLTDDLI